MLAVRATDPERLLDHLAAAEKQNRYYLKVHGKHTFGERVRRDISDAAMPAYGVHRIDGIYTVSPTEDWVQPKWKLFLVVCHDGAVRLNLKVRTRSLWSGVHGFEQLKGEFFAAAFPKRSTLSPAACERQLRCLLANAIAMNADPDSLFRVQRIDLFGSFLKGAERCGDVDVHIELAQRHRLGEMSPADYSTRSASLRRPPGLGVFDHVFWPETLAKRALKVGAGRVMWRNTPQPLLHEVDRPVTIFQRGMSDVGACIAIALNARTSWQTPERQKLREALADIVDEINADPESRVREAERGENNTVDISGAFPNLPG